MSKLVERLRGTYPTGPFGKRDITPYIPAIQVEAAARIEELEAALRDQCEAAEYWAGCDECVSHGDAASEILSSGGAWPSISYTKARQVLGKQEDK